MNHLPINLLIGHHKRQKQKGFFHKPLTLENAFLVFAALVTTVGIYSSVYNQPAQIPNPKIQSVKVSMQGGIKPRGPYMPPSAVKALARAKQNRSIQPEVLGDSTTLQGGSNVDLTSQIQSVLNLYLAQGKFKGDKGDPGVAQSVQNGNGDTTSVIGGNPIVSYYPSQSQNNFPGETLAGFTQLSSQNLSTGSITANQTTTGSLNVSGGVSLSTTTVAQLNAGIAASSSQTVITAAAQFNFTNGGNGFYEDSQKFLAIGPDGFARFVYIDNNYNELNFAHCLDQNCATKTDTLLAFNSNGLDEPTLVMGGNGFALISYVSYNSPNELHYIVCGNSDCSSKTDTVVATSQNLNFYYNALALGPDGFARIIYGDSNFSTINNLDFVKCTNSDCSADATSTLVSNGAGGDYSGVQIAMGPDGFPRISYTIPDPGQLFYIQCLNAGCSSKTNTLVDSGNSFTEADMVLGSDGFARIAYVDEFAAGAKFAQCTNAACSGSNITVINPNTLSKSISLVLGNDGLPRIEYSLSSGGENYVQCTNASCSTKNTDLISSTDGYPSSIALGQDGFARILYASSDDTTYYFARLLSDSGQAFVTGSSIGSASNPFGNIYGTTVNANAYYENGVLLSNVLGSPWVATSTSIYYNTGNVGIGTDVPQNGLDVNTGVAIGTYAGNYSTSYGGLIVSGQVGIGTPSPRNVLDVNGGVAIGTYAGNNSTSYGALIVSGYAGFGTSTPASALTVAGDIDFTGNLLQNGMPYQGTQWSNATSSIYYLGGVGIGTSSPNQALQVVGNISNIIASSTQMSQIATTTVGTSPSSVFVSGHYAYVANSGSNSLSVVDISNPKAPVQIGVVTVGLSPNSVYVSGHYAYVANYLSPSMSVVDVSNPKAPVVVGTVSVAAYATSVYVSGHYAYVTDLSSNLISVIDVSDPTAPVIVGTVTVETSPSDVYVASHYAYVTNYGSGTLSVVDISNPAAPVQVATTSVGSQPSAIYVSGRYAYVTNSGSNTMSVVDVSNPLAPVQVATTVIDSDPYSIYVSGRYAYITSFTFSTVAVVDVFNPLAPKQVASTAVGTTAVSVYVSGRYAYVVNRDSNNISVVDVSGTDTTSFAAGSASVGNLEVDNDIFAGGRLQIQNGINVTSGGILSGGALTIYATSSPSYFGDNVGIGTSTPNQALQVVGNISNIDTLNTTISQIATTSVGTGPHAIYVSGRYAYVANQNSNSISVVDISNPAAPAQISTTSLGAGNPFPNAIYVSGRYAYVTGAANILFVLDISNPAAPFVTATTSLPSTHLSGIYVSGHYAYLTGHGPSSNAAIYIVDISNPAAPVQVGTMPSNTNNPNSIYVSGRYAYVTNLSSNSISVVDISNPAAPVQVGTAGVGSTPIGIYVSGRYAYVANQGSNTISIVDISNPAAPVQVGTAGVGSTPIGIYVSGRYAYVANQGSNTISIVDISNPAAPVQVGTAGVGSTPIGIYVSGRYAYVANAGDNTISVVDISGTETTSILAGSADLGNLQVRNDALVAGQLQIQGGINVGSEGILSSGALAISATSSPSYFGDNVGIGTTSPQYLLQVGSASVASGTVARFQNANGTCDINPTTNTLACSSDSRLKKDINPLTDGFNSIMALQPVYFNWNAEPSSTPEHPGFIAQAVQQVMPSIVSTDPDSGLLSIGYSDIVPALVGAVQQEQNEITVLQGALDIASSATTSLLTVYNPGDFSGDSVGEAKILAGQSSVRVSFSQVYEYQPIVTITLTGEPSQIFASVDSIDASGFTIEINQAQSADIIFNWHSFSSPQEKLTVTGGSSSNIQLIVPGVPVLSPPVISDNSSGDDSTTMPSDSTTSPTDGSVLGTSTSTPPPGNPTPTPTPTDTPTPTPDNSTTTPAG